MKKLVILALSLGLFLTTGVAKAIEDDSNLNNDIGGLLEEGGKLTNDAWLNPYAYGRVWVCNSAYRGPFGFGNYYGWAYNANAAAANALIVCRNYNINDPYNCYVTNCYIR